MDDVIIDIQRTAKLYIEKHGRDAELVAAELANDLLVKGKWEEFEILLSVARAIRKLRSPNRYKVIH